MPSPPPLSSPQHDRAFPTLSPPSPVAPQRASLGCAALPSGPPCQTPPLHSSACEHVFICNHDAWEAYQKCLKALYDSSAFETVALRLLCRLPPTLASWKCRPLDSEH